MSDDFAFGCSTERDWALAVAEVAAGLVRRPATLGFLYLTDTHTANAVAIRDRLAAETGIEHWVGCVAPGIAAGAEELFARPAIAAMAADLPTGAFQVFDGAPRAGTDWFGIVHADPADPGLPEELTRLEDATGAFLVGGLTAAAEGGIRFADGLAGKPVSGVLFNQSVAVATGLTQGCNLFGPVHEVTACDRNIAIEIDGQPALAVLESDLRAAHATDPEILTRPLAAALPIADADRPDYLVRDFTGIDRKRGLLGIGALLRQGQRLQFCARDAHSAILDLDRMLDDVEKRLDGRKPKGAVYVSCVARGPHLFGEGGHELGRVKAALGDAPVVGFFAGGEISSARLYTYTGVLSVFT
ncbi:FIST signal transduction protein [Desertibaculum subflavum]|uniref:FIST signal transduction protein n=1 Tax=Desertibaculum subflavum TaxID=2268458 RepID=UPI000E663733